MDPTLRPPRPQAASRIPVIVLTEPERLDIVLEGARRAGGDPDLLVAPWDGTDALRVALSRGHELIVVTCRATESLRVLGAARRHGARPIPALSFRDSAVIPALSTASLALLSGEEVADLEVPVPAVEDDGARRALWDQLRAVRAEERHHLVEVDGRPALTDPAAGWASLAAGAAGVLAGRLAASNRRWRTQLDG